ncbi:ATP-binding cassette sub-family C member 9-like [Patiria miniata]|uniref:ABC-type glutathione-S-conjugate transporter n=1 Tax=Patiria miniata TaxID=46514 RepID=A0A914AYL2_PATMI|nr:ATP-binding cassette sub-family C member 9-like [Patiria miniata]
MAVNWEWLCGLNYSYIEDDFHSNTCLVDGLVAIPHAAFLLLSSLILLVLGCCTSYRRVHTNYLLVYPGHSLRWLVSVLLLVLIIASIGEGIMTDETYQAWKQPTQPHLYIHSIVAFVAVGVSLIYYHHMELWQTPAMSVLLMVYWIFSLICEVVRILNLQLQNDINVHVLLFDLTIIKLAIYALFIFLEMNVIRTKLCGYRHDDQGLPNDLKQPDLKCMHYNVNIASSLTFWWVNWLLALGYKKHLELSDLGVVPDRHKAKANHDRFRNVFREEAEKARKVGKQASLFKIYWKVYGGRMLLAGVLKLLGESLNFVGPLVLGLVTVYVQTIETPANNAEAIAPHNVKVEEFFQNGFVLVMVMFFAALASSVCLQTHFYISIIEGMNVGAAIQAMVYEKSLRLSTVAISSGEMHMGQITNHMSVDQDSIQYMFQNINMAIAAPIQIVVNLVLLYLQMGPSALIAASVFLVATPCQVKIAQFMGKQEKKRLSFADNRLSKTNELLQGIKLLKLYAWEGLYCKAIEVIRGNELHYLYKIGAAYICTLVSTFSTPVFVTILGFGTYSALTGKPLNPDVTFSALALFNMLFLPLIFLPVSLLFVINGVVSTGRVQKFLAGPEIAEVPNDSRGQRSMGQREGAANSAIHDQNPDLFSNSSNVEEYKDSADTERSYLLSSDNRGSRRGETSKSPLHDIIFHKHSPQKMKPSVAIKISNGNFLWDPATDTPVLSNINVEIPEGKLTIVIGQVGSGKSSLLSAILGEMTTVSGSVQLRDRNQIALAAQKPWLVNGTLLDNVLFSLQLDTKRYHRVIASCALKPDIDILPAGDQTEIGEKGINLSGGQKQRVSVARAVYSGRDIIILDDPLSALDVHVGSQLFKEAISKFLLGHRQTVVLVTHQLQYLNRADLIIKIEDGRIVAQGTLDDIITAYPDMYSEYNQAVKLATESEAEAEMSGYESESMKQDRLLMERQVKTEGHRSKGDGDAAGTLMEKEEIERGTVSYKIYMYYGQIFGPLIALIAACLSGLYAGLNIAANFKLSEWSESGLGNITYVNQQVEQYLGIFVAYEIGYLVCRILTVSCLVWGIMRAAKGLHHRLLRNIIRVPLRFFDTVPIGRVLNRFSNDTALIDVKISQTILVVIATFLNVVSSVVVNTIVMPIFIAFFVPVAIAFIVLQMYFLASSRELQRLNSTSKSPVLAFFSESLTGLTTIRAYRAGGRFFKALIDRINGNLSAFMYLQIVIRWVCIRLDFLGATTVLIAGMATLVGAFTMNLSSSLVGLALTYTLQIAQFLNGLTRMAGDLEMQMNGTERVKYYTGVSNEPYDGEDPPPEWPQEGRIQLDHVSVRYAIDTDTVLNDITLDFKAGEKVGICGRTGAGKSSLTLALLRVIDICQGHILIDGVDIKSVPLTTLRSKISIIPQDPVLFTGTIRMNLNPVPSSDKTDEELWHALEISQLKDVVTSLEGGLDFLVTEGGENFSVGQRQLFCLARAFLRKSRILIMDEATASMDQETDNLLQKVVEVAFAERTVLTIAHRISTILNSDSILVLDEGKLAEYGTPDELMAMEDGIFASFVRDKDK